MKMWPNVRHHGSVLYKDEVLKSQLEARWAVWLDLIGVPWEYEAEKYKLTKFGSRSHRIPDFTLYNVITGEDWILEIKPEIKPGKRGRLLNTKFVAEELLKMMIVAKESQLPCFMGFHTPGIDCNRYGITKNKNRSKVLGIFPTTQTKAFERIYFNPKQAYRYRHLLATGIDNYSVEAHHYVTPVGFEAWYFPSLVVLVCPTVYFRLTTTNRFYVDAQKPLRLSMKEFSVQTFVRKQLKFKEVENGKRLRVTM